MKIKDKIYNLITYIASSMGIIVLIAILLFVFNKGFNKLSFQMIFGKYWAVNYISVEPIKSGNFELINEIDGIYSKNWGIALKDGDSKNITITFIHKDSPFNNLIVKDGSINLQKGYTIEKIDLGELSVGKIVGNNAQDVISTIDNYQTIQSVYFKSQSGGIFGGVIATFYLILISLSIVLPIGISSSIYLKEYEKNKKFKAILQYGIDTLTGIPSLVYGLVGVTVLFPITQLVNINSTSILLGGLTMSIILLPTIIKATNDALDNVPDSLRQGSLSLGATNFQTIYKVVLPCCINGILTGVLLSTGRVIGESAALIYTMGTFVNDAPKISSSGSSLAVMIYSFMVQENPNMELASAVSIIILIIVMILNVILRVFGKKFERKLV